MPPLLPQYFQQPTTPATSTPKPRHPPVPSLPRKPLLRLEIRDLSSKGSRAFLSLPSSGSILENAVEAALAWLYTPSSTIPPTRSITLILRDMPGVAYTTGSDIDSDHKEIHFSTSYIEGQIHKDGFEEEVLGVITHEMVHCWQWNARGSCPGGLIEGIADFVRLRAGFVPGHWKKEGGGDWDAGYQHTGYFLDYLERRFGEGTVVKINETLRDRVYKEDLFWEECCGCEVKKLWKQYGKYLKKEKEKDEDGQVSEESFEIVEADEGVNEEAGCEDEPLTESQHQSFAFQERHRLQGEDGNNEDDNTPSALPDHQQNEKRKRDVDGKMEEEKTYLGATDAAKQQEQEWQDYQTQTRLQEQTRLESAQKEAEGKAETKSLAFLDYQEQLRTVDEQNERRKQQNKGTEEEDVVDATNPFL